jgi:hypothetical protein
MDALFDCRVHHRTESDQGLFVVWWWRHYKLFDFLFFKVLEVMVITTLIYICWLPPAAATGPATGASMMHFLPRPQTQQLLPL